MHYHLPYGFGLRQVTDWMMYIYNSNMNDWNEFNRISQFTGLYKLQQAMTKICIMYLGLPDEENQEWCHEAPDELFERLMYYICHQGNFGMNRLKDDFSLQFIKVRGLKAGFRGLQDAGLRDWEAVHNYSVLRHFAWLYELMEYLKRLNSRGEFAQSIIKSITEAKAIKKMFEQLE